jgi:cyclic pyranopterin phosphate synthase
MVGSQLSFEMVRDLLQDAREVGFERVRLYGGEPLLHKDLPRMVETAASLQLNPCITTNGILLGEKISDLYSAGLRAITIGFYGLDEQYNSYVQRKNSFARLEKSIATVREHYGMDVFLQINFLLAKPFCNLNTLRQVWHFAERYQTGLQVDLVHYSLPYFTEGVDRELQFTPSDRSDLEAVTEELVRMKESRPELFAESVPSIRSIPDWAIKGPDMQVPCTAYRLVWVGANGVVQLCYVAFRLGNLHEKRFKDMMFTAEHRQAARDAFLLKCPRCHCERDLRIRESPYFAHYEKSVPAGAPPPSSLVQIGTRVGL